MSALAGRHAVVTGVTSGIGAALAVKLIGAGATVAGLARDAGKLDQAKARLGERFLPFAVDLAVPEARTAALGKLAGAVQWVDVIVHNAAEVVYATPTELGVERWRRLLEVNALAGIELVERLAPKLRAGGHVVCVSSVTARFAPNARFSPYAVSKAAVERFVEGLRLELDPRGVKVTLIVPGLVDTPIYDKVDGFGRTRDKIREQIPTWLSSEDVAEAIVWTLERPPHVVVSELVLLPQGQAR